MTKYIIPAGLFFFLTLSYLAIRADNGRGAKLSQVDVVLASAVQTGDNPDVLALTVYFQNNDDFKLPLLSDPYKDASLFIEGKEYPIYAPQRYNRDVAKLSPKAELYKCFYFKVDTETRHNIVDGYYLKIGGQCLNNSKEYYLIWFPELSPNQNVRAIVKAL